MVTVNNQSTRTLRTVIMKPVSGTEQLAFEGNVDFVHRLVGTVSMLDEQTVGGIVLELRNAFSGEALGRMQFSASYPVLSLPNGDRVSRPNGRITFISLDDPSFQMSYKTAKIGGVTMPYLVVRRTQADPLDYLHVFDKLTLAVMGISSDSLDAVEGDPSDVE